MVFPLDLLLISTHGAFMVLWGFHGDFTTCVTTGVADTPEPNCLAKKKK